MTPPSAELLTAVRNLPSEQRAYLRVYLEVLEALSVQPRRRGRPPKQTTAEEREKS